MKLFNIDNFSDLQSESIVTVGMFDGVHVGHRHLLCRLRKEAKERALLPVVVTFDRHPRMVLRPDDSVPLLSTFEERMTQLESCGVENVAIINFDKETASLSACTFAERFLCGNLNMKVLLLGYDNMFGSRDRNDFDLLPDLSRRRGFEICRDEAVVLDGVEVSSTKIRRALASGDMRLANSMLGVPYSVSGEVVHGRHVGSGLGFPTANIAVGDRNKMLPAAGVYAMVAIVDGRRYAAMANLGVQPTFHMSVSALEVHIIDFSSDIYGKKVTVEFIDKIRDIETFDSPQALVAQLHDDCRKVKALNTNSPYDTANG
ncbi:MAG: riboflavin biosynthesis protein RibF [Bacteroidales bacterium]|nr:riboflavin biosynthesis protein RibF [Bacteroidales bacterium]